VHWIIPTHVNLLILLIHYKRGNFYLPNKGTHGFIHVNAKKLEVKEDASYRAMMIVGYQFSITLNTSTIFGLLAFWTPVVRLLLENISRMQSGF
jgi:hypothetical protein